MTTTDDGRIYGQEHGVTHYRDVEASKELADAGVLDLIGTPAQDGVDRGSETNWAGASIAVRASFDGPNPHHQLTIDYPPDGKSDTGRSRRALPIVLGVDGLPETVATVSHEHAAGMGGRLSPEQSLVMRQLIMRSIQAGNVNDYLSI